MKDILTAPFVEEMKQTTANMYRLGWDERNGGNISYLLREEEVAEYLDTTRVIRTIPTGFDAKPLIGKYFIVTGTGKYFKNVQNDPRPTSGSSASPPTAPLPSCCGGIRTAANSPASCPPIS